ncbi:magnesium transporter CorA family protein [Sedimentibacter sp. MB31-C6]|uniref:magnesium transporter CorA family protein n=1 Tax=Sedimentibacter sp. MB31-C6 TaxID=3109366 RepID=UPI002DDD3675|nr:magnesium transporter CorA family protein [Sedimentibacter sp. MB36-C1]WSI03309.1 magnesium transporter CorA family protein [Sedimentibacter sp. MB36-C1]
MLDIFKTIDENLFKLEEIEDGTWINLVDPTTEELDFIEEKLGVEGDFLRAALDEEESARLETENEQVLILVDTPYVEKTDEHIIYETLPLGIIITSKNIITICLKNSIVIDQFEKNSIRSFSTFKKYRFLYQILYKNAQRYLLYLRQIDRMSNYVEKQLHKSMKNKELIQLLDLEKSLVYITTALKANQIVLEKILRINIIKKYSEDEDLLEDVIIENKQAIEMANIYSGILSGTMDAFASIISNNLNIVMKLLTSITILMAIPTMFSSFYGMNVVNIPLASSPFGFWIVVGISLITATLVGFILAKKNLF